MTEDSRQLFERLPVYISDDQREFIDADANARYSELMAKRPRGRGRSPAVRDMIDFIRDNYPLFLQWIATRYQKTTEGK